MHEQSLSSSTAHSTLYISKCGKKESPIKILVTHETSVLIFLGLKLKEKKKIHFSTKLPCRMSCTSPPLQSVQNLNLVLPLQLLGKFAFSGQM